jgi:hypothetical protein
LPLRYHRRAPSASSMASPPCLWSNPFRRPVSISDLHPQWRVRHPGGVRRCGATCENRARTPWLVCLSYSLMWLPLTRLRSSNIDATLRNTGASLSAAHIRIWGWQQKPRPARRHRMLDPRAHDWDTASMPGGKKTRAQRRAVLVAVCATLAAVASPASGWSAVPTPTQWALFLITAAFAAASEGLVLGKASKKCPNSN